MIVGGSDGQGGGFQGLTASQAYDGWRYLVSFPSSGGMSGLCLDLIFGRAQRRTWRSIMQSRLGRATRMFLLWQLVSSARSLVTSHSLSAEPEVRT